ncbi:MAG: PH domain-containing protein [Oscillospiraceae bacterium]|nr:PH domain-containing protein [Oscillospiraceae bacterium]
MKRQHKVVILKYIKGKFWLLLLPVIRGLFLLKFDFYVWLQNIWMDIIVILLILGLAILKWYATSFRFENKELFVRKGLLLRREIYIPFSAISVVEFKFPVLFRFFKAVEIYPWMNSQKKKKGKIGIVVSEIDCLRIYNKMVSENTASTVSCKTSKKEILIFSVLFSSTLSGIIYLGTLLVRGEKIIGEKIKSDFFGIINSISEREIFSADGAASPAVVLTIIMGLGWMMSFIRNLLRHMNLKITSSGQAIIIENGCFDRWKYYVKYSRVNCVDLRQNMIMKTANLTSVHIDCSGYGTASKQSVFIPIATKKQAKDIVAELLPDFTQSNNLIRTKWVNIWLPITVMAGVFIVTKYLSGVFFEWEKAVEFFSVMLEVLMLYLLAVRIVARLTNGIGVSRGALTVRYCSAFRYHTVVVPKKAIAFIKIRRTPFRAAGGSCKVFIYPKGRGARRHCVRGVDYKEATFLIENYNNMQ